jgi:nicotinamide mononucleotide adenylyltransferase
MITKEQFVQKIRDDLFLTSKQLVMDKLPDNQNALFIGKFRVPTKAHFAIIQDAIKKYNHVVICIVKGKKNTDFNLPLEEQIKMFQEEFGESVSLITHSTGNLTSIINKSPRRIKYLISGTDRIEGYDKQLSRHPSLELVEIPRDNDISATNLISSLENDDFETFKKLAPQKLISKYDYLRKSL